jgi:hypothetical protein
MEGRSRSTRADTLVVKYHLTSKALSNYITNVDYQATKDKYEVANDIYTSFASEEARYISLL